MNWIKKRVVISIFLTIFCLVFSKDFWLEKTPFSISFDILNAKDSIVILKANRKDNNDFLDSKTRISTQKINDVVLKNVKFEIATSKKIRRIKFEISDFQAKKPIEIKNIKVNDEILIDDLEKFTSKDVKLTINKNRLVFLPPPDSKSTISILYDKPVKFSAVKKFNFEIFTIILVLSYLFAYKLIDYLADFSTIKNKSRIEIVFLAIFFILLFIPMSKIDDSKKAKNENRMLAKFQPLVIEGKINYNFGKDFDAWFSDRFRLRNVFLQANLKLKMINNVVNVNGLYYDKKYNLIYAYWHFYGLQKPDSKNLDIVQKKYENNLNRLHKYCKDRNIKLYVLVVPSQRNFFNHTKLNLKPDFAEELIKYLQNKTKIKIIYPLEKMMQSNLHTPSYFATDHHWTKAGTFAGYVELIKEIKKDFNNVSVLDETKFEKFYSNKVQATWNQEFYPGRQIHNMGIKEKHHEKILTRKYLYYKNPYFNNLIVKDVELKNSYYVKDDDEYFEYPARNNLKVLVIGNSFAQNLVEFLPYSFRKTLRLYDNNRGLDMSFYEPAIEEYKPNILILNYNTPGLKCMLDMYRNDLNKEEE